ncbi:zinc finger protein 888 isoform X2 [Drosophila busckii]|uniref:zinc finger protein 888 isoform X2 n=1 Tax=Drosophila busckii TaxID=30019 RepID=UPI00083F345B|nr:zinc finger protein 888 isoform X2 [Drosophila busckii]
MTRTCRICGGHDGRYWIETPVDKFAKKTFSQILFELARIEIAAEQADKLPPWICNSCVQKLEELYDFVQQARQTHELLLNGVQAHTKHMETATLECLRETPIQLLDIEGITIKTEEPSEPVISEAVPSFSVDPLVRKSIVYITSDEDDNLPLKQRKTSQSVLGNHHQCKKCKKSFKHVRNLFRHKQIIHGPEQTNIQSTSAEETQRKLRVNLLSSRDSSDTDYAEENYYKCDECDKSYKYIILLIKHKHKVHGVYNLPVSHASRKSAERAHFRPITTDSLVHSIIKEVTISDEDDPDSCGAGNYYECDQCDNSYKYIVSLIKHKHDEHIKCKDIEEIKDEATSSRYTDLLTRTPRISRRIKTFDLNRCKPNGSKEIQCMICLRRFIKMGELRDHLKAHPKNFTFDTHGEPIERISEGFFKTAVETTAAGLKKRILNDLKAGIYVRYYSITNEANYEMNLDSSDTDSDGEGDVVERRSYACELCNSSIAVWPRKYQLHEHHRQQHTWLSAPHVCQRCDSRFLSVQLLDHHIHKLCQNTLKRFMCDKCPQRFFWRPNLRAHLIDHKNKQDNYPCNQCSRSFQDKSAVTKHKLMHHDSTNKLLPCRWCTRTFYRPALLHKHVERHGFSGEDIPLAETLLADAAKSAGPKTIICKLCDMQFISIADLRRHMSMQGHSLLAQNYMIGTEEGFELQLDETDDSDDETTTGFTCNSYRCDLCQLTFQHRRDMNEHQYSLHSFHKLPYSCPHCIFRSVDKNMLEYHLRTQCANVEKKFKCSRCGYKFMWQENLELHMSKQHDKSSNLTCMPTKRRRFRYQCPHCWRSFVVQPSLDKHVRDMHVAKKNPGKKYLCSLCGLESITPNKLKIHMQRHNGEKPFKCDLCDMSFTVYYELKVHRRKHTGERPYQCTFCAKDFTRPDKLKRHVYMHSVKR